MSVMVYMSWVGVVESMIIFFFFFQAEDGIRDIGVTGVQTCALPISQRMVEEYASRLYVPAQQGFAQMQAEQFGRARQLTSWGQRIAGRWNEVKFVDVNLDGVDGPVSSGRKLALRATLDLAGLSPEDVREGAD